MTQEAKPPLAPSVTDVRIRYTNWRRETKTYIIRPLDFSFRATEHHPERQWMMKARDVERDVIREFAMKDIHEWAPAGRPQGV